MHNQRLDRAAALLTDILQFAGTVTDISALSRIAPEEFLRGPWLTRTDYEKIMHLVGHRKVDSLADGKIKLDRDWKKILAFLNAYQNRMNDCFSDDCRAIASEMHSQLARMCCRWIIEHGHDGAKLKCVEWLNMELIDEDWKHVTEACGVWVKKHCEKMDTLSEEKKALAKAYTDARDNMAEHLQRLWLELFQQKGIDGAVTWFRETWRPMNDDAKAAVNAAFIRAKQVLKK